MTTEELLRYSRANFACFLACTSLKAVTDTNHSDDLFGREDAEQAGGRTDGDKVCLS